MARIDDNMQSLGRGVSRIRTTVRHYIRGVSTLILISVLFSVLVFIGSFFLINNQYDTHITNVWFKALVKNRMPSNSPQSVQYVTPGGSLNSSAASEYVDNAWVGEHVDRSKVTAGYSFLIALLVGSVFFVGLYRFINRYGTELEKGDLIRGSQFADSDEMSRLLIGHESDITVGSIHLVEGSEPYHIFISGDTGTGKSNALKQIMDCIGKRHSGAGDKFIIYDKSGEYVRKYYREGFDVILNPYDQRMPDWNIWNEIEEDYDYEQIASSFLPDQTEETAQHFAIAARSVLGDILRKFQENEGSTSKDISGSINRWDIVRLYAFLADTDSKRHVDPENPHHTGSVLSTLANNTRCFSTLKSSLHGSGFSIRKWVRDPSDRRRVFINLNQRMKSTVMPLVTAWLDIAASEILSMGEDRDRRLFFIVDELASAGRINSLLDLVDEGRKFGGCVLLSITNINKLYEKYGREKAKALVSMCGTKICFRNDEPDSAKWLAAAFGEADIEEYREGFSVAENARGDSISMHDQRQERAVVTYSEFMGLPNQEAFVKLPGLPSTRITVPWVDRPDIARDFISDAYREPWAGDEDTQEPSPPPAASEKKKKAKPADAKQASLFEEPGPADSDLEQYEQMAKAQAAKHTDPLL
jgi:type IV conjugative transfer system coupling protein TraD